VSRRVVFLVMAALLVCYAPQTRAAGTLNGTVRDGTTGAPVAGVDVLLLDLQGGMEALATTKTDAEGRFHFQSPTLGQQPMLIRAVYRGVNFHQPAPPGTSTVNVEVFEPSRDPKTISVPSLAIVFQPRGSTLMVGEEYTIENKSTPPRAFYREGGNFEFELPEKAELKETAAWGPSGMPITEAPIDRGGNHYAVAYAFRPGENGIRFSYQLPYDANQTTVFLKSAYAHEHVFLVAPPGVQVTSAGFQPSGTEQGMSVYMRQTVAAGSTILVNLSGTGAAAPSSSTGTNDSGRTASNDSEPAVQVQVMPGRLDSLRWPLVAGFIALFALGAFFLVRRPVPAAGPASEVQPGVRRADQEGSGASRAGVDDLDQKVRARLDALKDTLFRLELRRQAGTISQEEYARERARIEKMVRDFIKG
jgi:hypothetical protein